MKKPGAMLGLVLGSLGKKPATLLYPYEKPDIPADFRGKLAFEAPKCIGCKICERDCPSAAIKIKKIADKQFEAYLAMDLCVYCGQCVESCPKDALEMTPEYELAQIDRKKLKVQIHGRAKLVPEPVGQTS